MITRKHLVMDDDDLDTAVVPVPAPVPVSMVFVFGSNEGGIHGAGAAAYARHKEGAVLGKGVGHFGNSYAIPTKDVRMHRGKMVVGQTLTLPEIKSYVDGFIAYATQHPELTFKVTQIGCGHAGLLPSEIAPLFVGSPSNCQFDSAWGRFLPGYTYWGTA